MRRLQRVALAAIMHDAAHFLPVMLSVRALVVRPAGSV
jgi:hypothetical protein